MFVTGCVYERMYMSMCVHITVCDMNVFVLLCMCERECVYNVFGGERECE